MLKVVSRRGLLALVGAVAALVVAPASAAPVRPFEPAAIAWLKRNAQPIHSANPRPDELVPLVRALDGGRVIGIGEATHGNHEDFVFKAALIRALIKHGELRVLALGPTAVPAFFSTGMSTARVATPSRSYGQAGSSRLGRPRSLPP